MTSILLFAAIAVAFVEYKKAHQLQIYAPMSQMGSCVVVPPQYAILQTVAGAGQPVWSIPPMFAGAPQGTGALQQSVLPPNTGRIAVGWNTLGVRNLDRLVIPANKETSASFAPNTYAPPVGALENQNGCICPSFLG